MNVRHAWSVVGLVLVASGCDEPAPQPDATTRPAATRPAPIQTRKTVGKTTQNVLDLAEAQAQGGVVVDNAAEAEEGGLGAYSQAYRHSVATIGGMAVEQKMKLYQAEHGSVPASHKEFMAKIIAPGTPDEVSLPMLPYYQEYAFDPAAKKLVVVEFPAKKEQRQKETTGSAGL
ncbi:MAG: hypothetical protein ACKO4T_11810 [Planctomycetaceae bacterium]